MENIKTSKYSRTQLRNRVWRFGFSVGKDTGYDKGYKAGYKDAYNNEQVKTIAVSIFLGSFITNLVWLIASH